MTNGTIPTTTSGAEPHRDLLTPSMFDSLRRTKPWVRLLSIVGMISAGLILLLGAFVVFGGLITSGVKSPLGGLGITALGLVYVAMGILYIFPSLYLYRYASAIGAALRPGSERAREVEKALDQQRSFWKFAGVLTLIMLFLYIPGVLAAIAIPNLLTAMQRSKEKRTAADIRTLATAVEAWAVDHNEYPETTSFDELSAELVPTYLKTVPRVDGWGNPLMYQAESCPRCQEYIIASGGKDGKLDRGSLESYRATGENEELGGDLVYRNGSFIQAPKSIR